MTGCSHQLIAENNKISKGGDFSKEQQYHLKIKL